MARSHGRVMASIWTDPDFLALEEGPQRLYMFLLSQPDLSHAGLVPMRIRRWAKKVAGASVESIEAHLETLVSTRFVVADHETEEVLIRTFVRGDGVYKQPKVMLRLREDARQIESPRLRSVFGSELTRLPLHELDDKRGGPNGDRPSTREQVEAVVETLHQDFGVASREGMRYPSERVSGRVSASDPVDNSSDDDENTIIAGQSVDKGVSDTHPDTHTDTPRVRAGAFPQPPTPNPLPPAPIPTTSGGGKPRAEVAIPDDGSSQTLIAEWIDHCTEPPPSRVKGHVAREIKTLLNDGIPYDRVRSGLAEWNAAGLHPSVLPSIVHNQANRQPRATKQNETDQLFERAMARAVAEGGQ